jgi:hypothetical protein
MEEFGAQQGPVVPVTSLRVSRNSEPVQGTAMDVFLDIQPDQQQRPGGHFLPPAGHSAGSPTSLHLEWRVIGLQFSF